MVKDAESASNDDKEKRAKVDLKNQADLLCYQSEKQIKELDTKLDKTKKDEIEDLIKDLRASIQTDDFDAIKQKTADLEKMIMEVGQTIYNDPQQPTNSDTTQPNVDNDNVIDTDFTD